MWGRTDDIKIAGGKLDKFAPVTKAELKKIEQTRQMVKKALQSKKKVS